VAGNGRAQAQDVKTVLDHFIAQPWIDKDHIVVVGQSHGGWTTLAFGAMNYPGVKALVNFAGGLRNESCPWRAGLTDGAASYGRESRVPSLWFYGENDTYFGPELARAMYERYVGAGGQARLVTFNGFGLEGHQLFATGASVWQPEVSKFLAANGLPAEPRQTHARAGLGPALLP
jgi:dienelactone hydrolase